ncbi:MULTISPECIES: universal stress protein [Myxococcus]|uniref:Universal stress protein n=1 Tax=Myxococcus llanfairpwllgwyngyllgogerychwyrndrobwllllantysiliogogogochensis TaxID=2590453 RepID=A0A540WVT8_9BACT|nr:MULTISPECIES: universal stress protein [Myxococcus]NTX02384.1 universal stress protein [Myxococcus sp. CA040A]TQF13131.1 universal stress protein [Myxococcus llanfairpwllgwyngyllgogerychwyrndrobwllllantysiliogogogochensis]
MAAPSRILVPIDLSEGSRTIIDYALHLARPFNASVEVVHAWEPPQYVAPDLLVAAPGWNALSLEQVAMDTARKELATLLQQMEPPQVTLKHRVLVGEAASTILELAEQEGFDLIIMGTHGRRGLPRLLLGSVAQKIVSRAPCPVLTLHVAPDKK